ncbi:hypothetical protein [Polyangium sorediatum]|uniref:Lipoprotein n=1 Tax=Polyangium sorediatum TaxID=889274 RepID=A0ABT6NHZ6_9BACT|nr:hypothetical protein [Polyangium sorediatum]MDI1427927.1 hypothetical protein [Polyangium sorediatum]
MRMLSILAVVSMSFLGLAACGDDTGGSGGSGGSGATGGMGGGGMGGMGGTGGMGGGGPSAGYCGKTCAMPADCCAMGVPNCPGADYPNNWTCDEGVCGAPQCKADADCTFGGALPNNKCLTESSMKICATPCMADADCTMPLKCTGEDDSGGKYCAGAGCATDADCGGYGKCNTTSGACECTADADCTGVGTDKCVL